MSVVFTQAARTDLAEAYEFIAQDSREAASRVLDRLVAVIEQLAAGGTPGT